MYECIDEIRKVREKKEGKVKGKKEPCKALRKGGRKKG